MYLCNLVITKENSHPAMCHIRDRVKLKVHKTRHLTLSQILYLPVLLVSLISVAMTPLGRIAVPYTLLGPN